MKKLITFTSENGKHCIASVSINSFKELWLNSITISKFRDIPVSEMLHKAGSSMSNVFTYYSLKEIKTERRESILLSYIDKHCGSSLNEIFEVKN